MYLGTFVKLFRRFSSHIEKLERVVNSKEWRFVRFLRLEHIFPRRLGYSPSAVTLNIHQGWEKSILFTDWGFKFIYTFVAVQIESLTYSAVCARIDFGSIQIEFWQFEEKHNGGQICFINQIILAQFVSGKNHLFGQKD